MPKPEKVAFEPGRKYYALMETNKGPVKIELMPEVVARLRSTLVSGRPAEKARARRLLRERALQGAENVR